MKGPGKLLPPIVVGVMGNTGIYLVPLMLGAMVSDRGFTEQQAGLVASADLAGYATTTFLTAMFLIRKDWRQLALTGIVVMILAFVRHRSNIQRLIAGTESKAFTKKKPQP